MADIPLGMRDGDPEPARHAGKVMNRAGVALSVALVIGTGIWGYKLLVRDVSGVPVVRALEGPMRKKPDSPGGEPAENQGLAVNKVAADGAAEKPADRLVLAPPPIQLTERDAVVEPTKAPVLETEKLEKPDRRAKPDPIAAPPALDGGGALTVEELAAQLAAGATPLSETGPSDTPPVKTRVAARAPESKPARTSPKPVIKGGVKRSLRPVLRPATLAAPAAEQVRLTSAAPAIEAAPKAVDAADIPVGTRMVQLGAFASPEIAAAEWDKLSTRFSDYLGQKTRIIQKASSGGKVFYRLRAMGFADVSDARRLCSALKAENADCIPVTTR